MNLRLLACSLLAGVVAAGLVACAAAGRAPQKTSMAPAGADAATPLSGRPDELRARIAELDAAITRDLGAAQVEAPDAATAAQMAATPFADLRINCDHTPSERCQDVCTLSASICDNAESICDLAAQLPGDAWAAERCGAAKAACQRATERCCSGQCAAPAPTP